MHAEIDAAHSLKVFCVVQILALYILWRRGGEEIVLNAESEKKGKKKGITPQARPRLL